MKFVKNNLSHILQLVGWRTKGIRDTRWDAFKSSVRIRLCQILLFQDIFETIAIWKYKTSSQYLKTRHKGIQFVKELIPDITKEFVNYEIDKCSLPNDVIYTQFADSFLEKVCISNLSSVLIDCLKKSFGGQVKSGEFTTVNKKNEQVDIIGKYCEMSFRLFEDITDPELENMYSLNECQLVRYYLFIMDCITIDSEDIVCDSGNYHRWKAFDLNEKRYKYFVISRDAKDPEEDRAFLYSVDI